MSSVHSAIRSGRQIVRIGGHVNDGTGHIEVVSMGILPENGEVLERINLQLKDQHVNEARSRSATLRIIFQGEAWWEPGWLARVEQLRRRG